MSKTDIQDLGVINCAIDPLHDFDSRRELSERLDDPQYLVALLQRAMLKSRAFSYSDKRFENVTPAAYRKATNDALDDLELRVVEALREFDVAMDAVPGYAPSAEEDFDLSLKG